MQAAVQPSDHHCRDLIRLFDRCFKEGENTHLVGGAQEPVYLPASERQPARIHFTHDYFASALHEVAHWCVAGPKRRQLEDYGYWYAPDGRTNEQQAEFERVEARPQALEWVFSVAADWPFRVSADNLNSGLGPSGAFKRAICAEAHRLCSRGPSPRVLRFTEALLGHYRPGRSTTWLFDRQRFALEAL